MKVLLSWSGERSKHIAESLRSWLPSVVQAVEPWISTVDIHAGADWHSELSTTLEQCSFGVLCITPNNHFSRWLLFEAGAISRRFQRSRLVPYVYGLRKDQLDGPLSHYQAVEATRIGTLHLLQSLNEAVKDCGGPMLSQQVLTRTLDLWWPDFEASLQLAENISDPRETGFDVLREPEIISVVLEKQRQTESRMNDLEELVKHARST